MESLIIRYKFSFIYETFSNFVIYWSTLNENNMELYPTCINDLKTVPPNFSFGVNLESSDDLISDHETIAYDEENNDLEDSFDNNLFW